VTAYLGLGSSLGDRSMNLTEALRRLEEKGVHVLAVSPVYESPHMGLAAGDAERFPAHLNCVARVESSFSASELMDRIRDVENEGGRVRESAGGRA